MNLCAVCYNHSFDRFACRAQWIGRHECRGGGPIGQTAALDRGEVAHHEGALVRPERARAGMTDKNVRRADVAEAGLGGPQAEIDILAIAAAKGFAQASDAVEARA